MDLISLSCQSKTSLSYLCPPGVKYHPVESCLYVIHAESLAYRVLRQTDSDEPWVDTSEDLAGLTLITKHAKPITCFGVSEEGWLICSCSDGEIVLSKQDSMLKTFNSVTIGVGLGKFNSCDVHVLDDTIMIALGRASEMFFIQCVATENPLTELGPLALRKMENFATCKVNGTISWIHLLILEGMLHVIGMADRNVVSTKIWEVTPDRSFKIKDHRMTASSKPIAGVDIVKLNPPNTNEFGFVIVQLDQCELYAVSSTGFTLLARIKLDDLQASIPSFNVSSELQIDFRIFCAQFFFPIIPESEAQVHTGRDAAGGDELEDLNNTLAGFTKSELIPAKIHVVFATSRGLVVMNLRSGEVVFSKTYEKILKWEHPNILSSAKLFSSKNSNVVTCLLHPLIQKQLLTFRIQIGLRMDDENTVKEIEEFSFVSAKQLLPKSVLRKKLKSPPPPPPVFRRRFSNQGVSRNGPSAPSGADGPKWSRKKPKMKPPVPPRPQRQLHDIRLQDDPENSSSRSVKVRPKSRYNPIDDFDFETEGSQIPTRLSEIFSQLRMQLSTDGRILAIGGNAPPLIIFKTFPTFEPLVTFKESGRITALDFSFNDKNLLVATNDGCTDVIDWKGEKQLLSLKFNSKFNENVGAKFYYMDKFIVQPEDNRLVLYMYRIQEPNSVTLKAGNYVVNSQKITSIAAPNQFYSSTILYACSNKNLTIFDANAETVALNIPNAHSKPITTIRINDAPKGPCATSLCDIFITCTNSPADTIKLWDLRSAKCVSRIGDLNPKIFVPTSRPGFSPCGRYIASGFEENVVSVYDVRKINSKVTTLQNGRSSVLDVAFDTNFSMLWCGCRNGNICNFTTKS